MNSTRSKLIYLIWWIVRKIYPRIAMKLNSSERRENLLNWSSLKFWFDLSQNIVQALYWIRTSPNCFCFDNFSQSNFSNSNQLLTNLVTLQSLFETFELYLPAALCRTGFHLARQLLQINIEITLLEILEIDLEITFRWREVPKHLLRCRVEKYKLSFSRKSLQVGKFSWETNWRCQFIVSTSILSEKKSPWKSYFMSFQDQNFYSRTIILWKKRLE